MKITVLTLVIFTLTLLTSLTANAEFDPSVLSQSTVRILIKTRQGVVGAASGFLWQSNDQIVTSLHVMSNDPKARIIIEFGKIKRRATIAAVLPNADLVLLKIKKPVPGWLPLTKYNPIKPKYKSEISALGFNQGALGMSTRELRKGFVNPEQLQVLLPPNAVANLTRAKVLDVKLPIYYLDGSLLPGYSGSPVVDSDGILVGIGDGGLESGAASVSWVIPASNLDRLMASTINKAPKSLDALGATFSGDVIASVPRNRADNIRFDRLAFVRGWFDKWVSMEAAGLTK
ncbi:MAG: trypsin-like peptidase domain-containing protein, partial [Algicola sp.]|nr:trypsin-like peptidase domain-containing protein [Algicola sp.]